MDTTTIMLVGGLAAGAYFLYESSDPKTPTYTSSRNQRDALNIQLQYEEMYQPLIMNLQMPSAAFSSSAFTPTPEMRHVDWTNPFTDFRDARLAVAEFHARERTPLIGGPNAAGRNVDEPLRFIPSTQTRTPYNEIY